MAKPFEICPKCSKRGIYQVKGYPFWGDGTKRCRYCGHIVRSPLIEKTK